MLAARLFTLLFGRLNTLFGCQHHSGVACMPQAESAFTSGVSRLRHMLPQSCMSVGSSLLVWHPLLWHRVLVSSGVGDAKQPTVCHASSRALSSHGCDPLGGKASFGGGLACYPTLTRDCHRCSSLFGCLRLTNCFLVAWLVGCQACCWQPSGARSGCALLQQVMHSGGVLSKA